MIIPVVTFVVLTSGIYAAYWFFVVHPEEQAAGALKRRLKPLRGRSTAQSKLLKQMQALSAVGPFDAALKRTQSRTQSLQDLIEQSGVRTTLGTVLLGMGTLGLLAFVVVQQLTEGVRGLGAARVLIAIAAAVAMTSVPVLVLRYMRTLRMRKFEEQFPEALDLLARALRAGHAFTTGIEIVAAEMPKPVGPEFRLLFDRQNYGMPLADALRSFAARIPVLDARFFVTAVLIQRESGGNLAEVLDNLSKVIRERFRVKRQMRVISAHGRITGWILVGLPPVLALVLMSVSAEHRVMMFGTAMGIQMMIAAGVMQIVGTLIIRKIINVEY